MNKEYKMTKNVIAFLIGVGFTFLVYWAGGGDFTRGQSLGFTGALSIPIGFMFAILRLLGDE